MNIIIQQPTVDIYEEANDKSKVVTHLRKGDRIALLGRAKAGRESWVEIQYSEGTGFMRGNTDVFLIRKTSLNQRKLIVYQHPSLKSQDIFIVKKGETFALLEAAESDGKKFIKIRAESGQEGWAQEGFRVNEPPTSSSQRRSLIIGFVLLAIGIGLTALDTNPDLSNPRTYLQWISIVYGAYKFSQGVRSYIRNRTS